MQTLQHAETLRVTAASTTNRDALIRARSTLRALSIELARAAESGIGLTASECREYAIVADDMVRLTGA